VTLGSLLRLLAVWATATALVCAGVHHAFSLTEPDASPAVVASVWQRGQVVARALLAHPGDHDAAVDAAAAREGATLVYERIVAEGPAVAWSEATLALSFVAGRDGFEASLPVEGSGGRRTAYVTPDDLLAIQAYDKGVYAPAMQVAVGLDIPLTVARAAETLGVAAPDLLRKGTFRRFRVVRDLPGVPAERAVTSADMTIEDARDGAVAMGRYLARGIDDAGRFRYLVNATTDQTLPGYDWPRHSGATYFVAQVAALTGDPDLRFAALKAASQLRDHALVRCGDDRCIGDEGGDTADLGSTALAVLAFVEMARARIDEGYALLVPELTAFLRDQQRTDGEFMHIYDRAVRRPVDVQLLYYSGEAAFALGRASSLTGDPRDLAAAMRGLAHLVGPGWSFFGSRYYWGEEHWTCQAMDELWGRGSDETLRAALDFCIRWHQYGEKLMFGPGDSPFDADGAYGVGPLPTPHLTPAGSRSESGLATLDAARRAGRPAAELTAIEQDMRRSLAMLLRHQFRSRPARRAYLLADPAAEDGGMPASEADWQIRIDYAQHSGCALLRWLALQPTRATPEPHGLAPDQK
jgi:hypothetical protein